MYGASGAAMADDCSSSRCRVLDVCLYPETHSRANWRAPVVSIDTDLEHLVRDDRHHHVQLQLTA